ncbi:glucokinase [Desulfovibrio sp. OttesenSCG-928-F07]|nr:glucokinase [Desulfovibrio sp. OttesenSCG-928-F07]
MQKFILTADIGGTFSRFALFSMDYNQNGLLLTLLPQTKIKLNTQSYKSFAELLNTLRHTPCAAGYPLLPEHETNTKQHYNTGSTKSSAHSTTAPQISACVFAVPGAVNNGECTAPNIQWPLTQKVAEHVTGTQARLINDFAAQGLACLFSQILGLRVMLKGSSSPQHPQAVLGAGTGLGHALLLPKSTYGSTATPYSSATNSVTTACSKPSCKQLHIASTPPATSLKGTAYNATTVAGKAQEQIIIPVEQLKLGFNALNSRVLPSEGGHAIFAFKGKYEHEFESFCYDISKKNEIIGDMVVTGYGLSLLYAFHTSSKTLLPPHEVTPLLPQCPAALEWLARFYGRACKNFALATLSLGGVYLAGGMLSHVPGLFAHPAFEQEFRYSETQKALLANIPVSHITNPDTGLWGAAIKALEI